MRRERSSLDQLELDEALRRTDLDVEVPQEVHADEPVDVLVAERENREREVGRCRVGPETFAWTTISSRSRSKGLEIFVIEDQARPNEWFATNAGEPDGT